MANLQVKNVPDVLHERMRRTARASGCTLSDFVLSAVGRELERREWHERLASRPETDLGGSAAQLLKEEREARRRAFE